MVDIYEIFVDALYNSALSHIIQLVYKAHSEDIENILNPVRNVVNPIGIIENEALYEHLSSLKGYFVQDTLFESVDDLISDLSEKNFTTLNGLVFKNLEIGLRTIVESYESSLDFLNNAGKYVMLKELSQNDNDLSIALFNESEFQDYFRKIFTNDTTSDAS